MSKVEQFLLADGNILNIDHESGEVFLTPMPEVTPSNDKTMIETFKSFGLNNHQSTDIQILYFYNKYNGDICKAAHDLEISPYGYKYRLKTLNLKSKRKEVK